MCIFSIASASSEKQTSSSLALFWKCLLCPVFFFTLYSENGIMSKNYPQYRCFCRMLLTSLYLCCRLFCCQKWAQYSWQECFSRFHLENDTDSILCHSAYYLTSLLLVLHPHWVTYARVSCFSGCPVNVQKSAVFTSNQLCRPTCADDLELYPPIPGGL